MEYADLLDLNVDTTSNVEEVMTRLCETLDYHSEQYYNFDAPKISDSDYDKLMNKLIELETAFPEQKRPDSPSQRVGGAALSAFEQVRHDVKLLSLGNAYGRDDLIDFHGRVEKDLTEPALYTVEYKIDDKYIFRNEIAC